jgi:hypothetical protein
MERNIAGRFSKTTTSNKMKLAKNDVRFKVEGKQIEFSIVHNLLQDDFRIAFDSWAMRTKKYTAESLCNYIKSKGNVAMTYQEYKQKKDK